MKKIFIYSHLNPINGDGNIIENEYLNFLTHHK